MCRVAEQAKAVIVLALVGLGLLAVSGRPVHALADPTTINIEQVRRYPGVSVTGDALFVVHYQLLYTVAPSESIAQGWVGRLMDVGGSGQLASVAPSDHAVIPNDGYSHGVYSFYFAVAPVPTGTLTVTLEGNPGLSPTPAGINTSTIESRAASDLTPDMRELALHFETVWNQDVITFAGGPGRLTTNGDNYFLAAIPNLVTYAPDLFSLGFIQPDPAAHIDSFDSTFQTGRQAIWAGTPIRTATDGAAAMTGMSRTAMEIVLILIVAGVLAWLVYRKTDQQEIGIFVALLWINVAAVLGFGVFALPYTLAFTAVLVFAYLMFFKQSAA